jgi:hypothetical protein
VVTAPIVGATTDAHLDDAVAAVDLHRTDEDIARLEEPYTPHAVAGFRTAPRPRAVRPLLPRPPGGADRELRHTPLVQADQV